MSELAEYRNSGRVPFKGLVFGLGFGLVVGPLLAAVYVTATWLIRVNNFDLLFIVGSAAIGALMDTGKRVYCEACRSWCTDHDDVLRFTAPDDQISEVIGEFSRGDFTSLTRLNGVHGEMPRWFQVGVAVCDGCGATNTFSVAKVTVTLDAKGNREEESEMLLANRLIGHQAATWILRFGGIAVPSKTWATT